MRQSESYGVEMMETSRDFPNILGSPSLMT